MIFTHSTFLFDNGKKLFYNKAMINKKITITNFVILIIFFILFCFHGLAAKSSNKFFVSAYFGVIVSLGILFVIFSVIEIIIYIHNFSEKIKHMNNGVDELFGKDKK